MSHSVAERRAASIPAVGPRRFEAARVTAGRRSLWIWQAMYVLFLVQEWLVNLLRPADRSIDALERGEVNAPHIAAGLGIMALVGVYAGLMILRAGHAPLRALWRSRSLQLFTFYVAATLLSTTYSTIWTLTLVSSIKWIVALALVAVYVQRFHAAHCWRPAIAASLFTLVGGHLLALVVAALSGQRLGFGEELYRLSVIDHPVRLGLLAALTLLMGSFWVFRSGSTGVVARLAFRWGVGALSFLMISLTLSRTGLFALTVVLAIALLGARRRGALILTVLFPLMVAVPLIGLVLGGDVLEDMADRLVFRYSRQETYSLTGRFPVWDEALDLIARRPLTGYGFVAGPRTELPQRLDAWLPSHAHNAWLQAALDIGVPGALLLAASALGFLSLARRALRSSPGRNEAGEWCGCQTISALVVILLIIASMPEPVFAAGASVTGVLWLLAGSVLGLGRSCRMAARAPVAARPG